MKRILFVFNPCAGKGKIASNLSRIVCELGRHGQEVVIHATTGRDDAKLVAQDYAARGLCDRIVCAGGDGTVNEVVTGVMNAKSSIPIGIIPAGSTNDFGYTLRLPKDLAKAAAFAANAPARPTDMATLNGRYLIYTAAFGLFSDVSYATSQKQKNVLGHLAYILNGIKSLADVKVYHVKAEYGSQVLEDDFIHGMVVSADSVGGFRGLPGKGVEIDDGLFEMIFVRNPKTPAGLARTVDELLLHKFENAQYIRYAKVKSLKVTSQEKLAWSLDGEYGGETSVADIEVLHRAVNYVRR
ncbi:MAG: YegS/Rv2252/BmrU family lipid kinase [Lachnospiraceae bacterium]|nr:YegS/Rv2252/BmrU family lipid kinase [Lachnospiraceae bacterium]